MTLFGLALAVLFAGACGAVLMAPHPRWATRLGAGGAVLGSAVGLVPAVQVLVGRDVAPIELPWSVPSGQLSLGIDALSAFFLMPIFTVGAATASYGAAYLRPEAGHKQLGMAWLWFDLLLASMALVATARNGLLFLVAWEGMALSSFFLVVFHHERAEVPRAGWVYLVATHVGTAFLLVLFAWLAQDADSLDFARWSRPESGAIGLFALALIGFGSKAGLFPFHVWLPEAHPVAPSHVSALLSGVMVKLGIYGLLRMLVVLGPPDLAWGSLLLAVGLASAVYGGLAVLAERDLKRCLAYSTVENLGIVAVGLGLGVVLLRSGSVPLASLALAGGLLHVWNHALFKSLLFLAAGSVARGAGTLDLESLGGLERRMPWTGLGLLVGGAAACALPPFNGFVGEFLIYLSAFRTMAAEAPSLSLSAGLAASAGLAFVGALAAAGFVRLLGIALLGEPRSEGASRAHEAARSSMRVAIALLGAACLVLGLGGAGALAAAARPVAQLSLAGNDSLVPLQDAAALLWKVGAVGGAFAAGALVLLVLRRRLLPKSVSDAVGTWDCGYAAPEPRMQYTASSFAEPLTRLFGAILNLRESDPKPSGVFPLPATFTSTRRDAAERLYAGLFAQVANLGALLRRFETGNAQLYVLYTVLAALALLGWGLVG
jgi:formate hydrogenlyase subunit 3/multisubunit Na+/H+ antiporter MnhD subunit